MDENPYQSPAASGFDPPSLRPWIARRYALPILALVIALIAADVMAGILNAVMGIHY